MSLGPVFYVEMLTLGRRRRYVLTRMLYGLLLLFVMGTCYMAAFESWRQPVLQQQSQFAYAFFVAFSWVQLIGVLFLTPAMTAGTIAGEHERRTIDYLLTTSLYDSEITLGKYTARVLAIAAQLAAGVPILAIAMMLGGIAPEQLVQSFIIALSTLLSVGGMCLALSTRARTSREAIVRAYVILIAVLVIPPLLWAIFKVWNLQTGADVCRVLTELDPIYYLGVVLIDRNLPQVTFPYFVATHVMLAVATAASSVYGLRRFYVKQAGKAPPQRRTKAEKPTKRWALVPAYSMLWKELTAGRSAIRLGLLGRIAALGLYAMALWFLGLVVWEQFDGGSAYGDREAPHAFGMVGVPMIASLCVLLVASRAAGSITSEREQDTWITLVSTPLTGREIVWAKFCAALYSVKWWYYLVAAAWLLCVVITPEFVWAVPLLMFVHLAVLALTAALGVLCSLNSATSLRAMGMALAVIVLGLSIAPLFCAVLVRSETLLGFSLPVLLGGAHFAMWQTTHSTWGRHDSEFAAILTAAALLYAVAALICYSASVVNFDAMIGRTTEKLGAGRTHVPEPQANSVAAAPTEIATDQTGKLAVESPGEPEQRA